MLSFLLLSSALAAPPGYTVSKTDVSGCELSLGPAAADGVVPMHAECVWPDVTLDHFKAKMGSWPAHKDLFSTVVESTVKRTEGDKSLVYQVHRSSGIADREVLFWGSHRVVDGYERYEWTKSTEPLTLISGNVETAKNTGYWQAKARPEGGVHVVYELSYGPGGSVWGWVVRAFQTSGLTATVTEAHAALKYSDGHSG